MLMKFYAWSFEKVCTVASVLILILGMIAGFVVGYGFIADLLNLWKQEEQIAVGVGFLLGGAALAMMFNIIVFGFIAQITEIKKSLDEIKRN